jgi:hypothetical protein
MAALSAILQLIGALSEIYGAILMANQYIATPKRDYLALVTLLLDALSRGKISREATSGIFPVSDNKLTSLQGLAYIGLGFLLQFFSALCSLLGSVPTSK